MWARLYEPFFFFLSFFLSFFALRRPCWGAAVSCGQQARRSQSKGEACGFDHEFTAEPDSAGEVGPCVSTDIRPPPPPKQTHPRALWYPGRLRLRPSMSLSLDEKPLHCSPPTPAPHPARLPMLELGFFPLRQGPPPSSSRPKPSSLLVCASESLARVPRLGQQAEDSATSACPALFF